MFLVSNRLDHVEADQQVLVKVERREEFIYSSNLNHWSWRQRHRRSWLV